MAGERIRARVFGEVADEYERIRPGYPDELVDAVLAYARPAGGGRPRTLEVGAGTGKATRSFVGRGIAVTAVEPDPAMAAVLSGRLGAQVRVVVAPFESYQPPEPFDLLFSAQAWHWVDPARRWLRAAEAITPGGALALFWHQDRIADPELRATVHEVHLAFAVEEDGPWADASTLASSWPASDLAALPGFGDLTTSAYPSVRTLSSVDYLALLSTRSAYRILDGALRQRVTEALRGVVGETVTLDVQTVLYLARRLPE